MAILSLRTTSLFELICELDTEPPRSPRKTQLRLFSSIDRITAVHAVPLFIKKIPQFSVFSVTRCRALRCFIALEWLFLFAACTSNSLKPASPITDDFGDTVVISQAPKRVVSLNPATTEIIFAIGAGDRLVGRTHWDLYPAAASKVADLGSGIRPNVEAVLGARPDLVLLYASVDNRPAAARLHDAGIKTLSLKIDHIADFHRAVRLIGRLLVDSARAATVEDSVQRTLDRVRSATTGLPTPTVFWHIWDAPLITIGRGSYMNELIEIAGGRNVYANMPDVSPTVGIEDVLQRNPQYIITGPEGSTKIQSDRRWSIAPAVKAGRILVADTALVGRPAVRLGEAAIQLATLLHPEIAPRLRQGER